LMSESSKKALLLFTSDRLDCAMSYAYPKSFDQS
jgi:hypothetical protein